MLDVRNFIKRRSNGLTIEVPGGEGYFDYENGGVWVEPEPSSKKIEAIVMPVKPDEVIFDEGGAHINLYRKVYCYEVLEQGSKVKFKDVEYTVMEESDYSDFAAGLRVYYIKRGAVR